MSNPSPFEVLGLNPCFELDATDLDRAYHQKARLAHPDQFAGASPLMERAAQAQSAQLNKAYKDLQNPVIQSQWMLTLQGYWPPPEDPEILEDMLTLQEACSAEAIRSAYQKSLKRLAQAFASKDWKGAAKEHGRFNYLFKLQGSV